MADIMEITELEFDDNNFGSNNGFGKSTNFGGGLELLMNDRIKESNRPTSDINFDDLNNLENELNDLANGEPIHISRDFNSNLFGNRNINTNAGKFTGPMIGRIHSAKPGCGCGRK